MRGRRPVGPELAEQLDGSARARVRDRFGVELRREVEYLHVRGAVHTDGE